MRKLNRREFIARAIGGAAGAVGAGLWGSVLARRACAEARRKPNVIIVLADDMGFADASFQGSADIPTPNLDALAAGGMKFTSGYVSHPFCSPTRAGLMTGRYQHRFGHENNPRYDPSDNISGLPVDQVTLPQVLRQAGYVTGIVGKWHLGAAPHFHPLKRGFAEQFGFIGGGHDYFKAQMTGNPAEYFIPIQRDGKPVAETDYLTDAFSREAVAFVRRHAKEPFFLYLAYNAPHTPLQVSEKYLNRFSGVSDQKRRLYSAMVSAIDEGVRQLVAALREAKIESDTLVFFLSDNGGPVGARGNGSRNDPLREGKGSVYEGGIRVPFVAYWPGKLTGGTTYDQPVISLDIFPTAAALAGAEVPSDRKMDGVNLMPHLLGEKKTPPHERLFWRTGGGTTFAIRQGRYKLLRTTGEPKLYDLEADLGETKDLAAEKPDLRDGLLKAYEEWNAEMVAPIFQGLKPAPAKKTAKKP